MYLTAAAERVEQYYPSLAKQARGRIESVDQVMSEITLLTDQQSLALQTNANPDDLEPITINSAFEEFISPDLDTP